MARWFNAVTIEKDRVVGQAMEVRGVIDSIYRDDPDSDGRMAQLVRILMNETKQPFLVELSQIVEVEKAL